VTLSARTWDIFEKFVKFCGVGVVSTACDYIAAFLLFEFAGWAAQWAGGSGAVVGAVVNYWLNRTFTFQSTRDHREATWRFAVVAVGAAVLNWLILKFIAGPVIDFVGERRIGFMIAKCTTTLLVLLWTFPVNLLWTFADGAKKDAPADESGSVKEQE
jgi:putative flippase GtrA